MLRLKCPALPEFTDRTYGLAYLHDLQFCSYNFTLQAGYTAVCTLHLLITHRSGCMHLELGPVGLSVSYGVRAKLGKKKKKTRKCHVIGLPPTSASSLHGNLSEKNRHYEFYGIDM